MKGVQVASAFEGARPYVCTSHRRNGPPPAASRKDQQRGICRHKPTHATGKHHLGLASHEWRNSVAAAHPSHLHPLPAAAAPICRAEPRQELVVSGPVKAKLERLSQLLEAAGGEWFVGGKLSYAE